MGLFAICQTLQGSVGGCCLLIFFFKCVSVLMSWGRLCAAQKCWDGVT